MRLLNPDVPLTEDDLASILTGQDWREVTCPDCGKTFRVMPNLQQFTCTCAAAGRPVGGATMPTRPTAIARLVAEVRHLRALVAATEWAGEHLGWPCCPSCEAPGPTFPDTTPAGVHCDGCDIARVIRAVKD